MSTHEHRSTSQPRLVRLLLVTTVALLCTACGSFPLGTSYPLRGQSQTQVDTDILFCKDRAKNEANTDARVAGSFIAGLTIVGAPIAIAEERRKTREVYAECMAERGYRVVPPDDGSAKSTTPNATVAPAAPAPKTVSKLSLVLPSAWSPLPLTEQMANGTTVLYMQNRTIDAGVLLDATKREGITDISAFHKTRCANQVNRLTAPQQSAQTSVDVGGRTVFRCVVSGGVKNGTQITYLLSVVQGEAEIATVNAWTTTANFENQRATLEALTSTVTGL